MIVNANIEGAIQTVPTSAEIVYFSTGDVDLNLMAQVYRDLKSTYPGMASLSLVNLVNFKEETLLAKVLKDLLPKAQLVILKLHGGRAYHEFLCKETLEYFRRYHFQLILLPDSGFDDEDFAKASTVDLEVLLTYQQYFSYGGQKNMENALKLMLNSHFGYTFVIAPPEKTEDLCIVHPELGIMDDVALRALYQNGKPIALVLAYNALWKADNYRPAQNIALNLMKSGVNALMVFIPHLKDPEHADHFYNRVTQNGDFAVDCIVCTNGFSIKTFDEEEEEAFLFSRLEAPVVQAIPCYGSQEAWEASVQGMAPNDLTFNVILPEIDGRVITRPVSFRESSGRDEDTGGIWMYHREYAPGCSFVANYALNLIKLRSTPNDKKRIAMILHNHPGTDSKLAYGVGLDTPESAAILLQKLKDEGYFLGDDVPVDGASFMKKLTRLITNDPDTLHLRPYQAYLPLKEFKAYFDHLSDGLKQSIQDQWGDFDDDPYFDGHGFALPGFLQGNIFVSNQPARGYSMDPDAVYHSKVLPPPYYYFAYYCWLQGNFKAHAMVSLGKHGNLEWLPGKSVTLDESSCFPAAVLGPLPHLYPYIINDPGEGVQAKRRSHAVILDHLIPPMTRAEIYGPLMELEDLLDEYHWAKATDPNREKILKEKIVASCSTLNLQADLHLEGEFEDIVLAVEGYLSELKEAQIRGGLHIYGVPPEGENLVEMLIALHRLPSGDHPGITQALARDLDLVLDPLETAYATAVNVTLEGELCRNQGDVVEWLEHKVKSMITSLINDPDDRQWTEHCPQTFKLIEHIVEVTLPALLKTSNEMDHLLQGLNGAYVPSGPAGSPTRGNPGILPTGKNFFSIDPRTMPTPVAYEIGVKSAEQIIEKYIETHGHYPRSVGLSLWGTSNMRTGGDDVAQAFALMGVKPVWNSVNRQIKCLQIISVKELKRPRVDVTWRISGFFRDAFPHLIKLFNEAVALVAGQLEDERQNPLRSNYLRELTSHQKLGLDEQQAREAALFRVFGCPPGDYGTGVDHLIDNKNWKTKEDLAEVYLEWSGHAYVGDGAYRPAKEAYRNRLSKLEIVLHNQDNREHDILDNDDYYQFQGGMANAVGVYGGKKPEMYFGDHSRPEQPQLKTLKEEIMKVYRSRVINPKWIEAMKKHGYKGAQEIAVTVDYAFGFDATTETIDDFMYQGMAEAYLFDQGTLEFLQKVNPWAIRDIAEKLLEAIERNMWEKPEPDVVERLRALYLKAEDMAEERS